MGKTNLAAPERIRRKIFFIRNNVNLDQLLQRFWENEKLRNKRTTEEILCEVHFEKQHTKWNGTLDFENSSTRRSNPFKRVFMKKQDDGVKS